MKKSDIENQSDNYSHKFSLVVLCVLASICFLTVGYSAFSNTLTIEGILATVKPVASARISDLSVSGTSNGGYSEAESFNMDRIYGTLNLPNADSTVTYKIDVTVFLSSEMKLTSITGLSNDLEYTLTDYTLGDIICENNNANKCNLGATREMYLTIGYKNGAYTGNNTSYPFDLNFNFQVVNIVAKIGNTRYQTLQDAVNDVPANNTTVVIDVISNTSEEVTINSGQDVRLNMHGNTITSTTIAGEKRSIFENNGTLRISDGTFVCNAGRAAINNMGGTLYLSGGTVTETGTKQAINNENGAVAYISGNPTLTNVSTNRAVIQNKTGSTLYITGGTLTASNFDAIENDGIMTIGTKDGTPANSPIITGKPNGVLSNTSFNFYDGIIKGSTAAFNDESLIADTDPALMVMRSTESISGTTYQVYQLGIPITITFDGNGGTPSEVSRTISQGGTLTSLPTATRANYTFAGWYDDPTNGNEITTSTTFNNSDTIYAHWSTNITITFDGNGGTPSEASRVIIPGSSLGTLPTATRTGYNFVGWYDDPTNGNQITTSTTFNNSDTIFAHWSMIVIASIGNTDYPSIQDAVTAAASQGHVTITVAKNLTLTKRVSTSGSHNITFDLQNHTLSTTSDMPIFENQGGTIVIKNGTLNTTAPQAAINNKTNTSSTMTIEDLTVNATGTKQAVYNEKGTLYIKSGCILTNTSTNRGAVQNTSNGKTYITGGTITSSNFSGVVNDSGTLEIGNKDGNINTSTPNIRGKTYGVDNSGTFNFYDGVLKGISAAHHGSISDQDGSIVSGTEVIGSDTYNTEILQ